VEPHHREFTMATKEQDQRRQKGDQSEPKTKAAGRATGKVAHNNAKRANKAKTVDPRTSKRTRKPAHEEPSNGRRKRKESQASDLGQAGKSSVEAEVSRELERGEDSRQQSKTPRTQNEEMILRRLFEALQLHATAARLGHVASDARFDWGAELENPDLHPDIAYVSFDRWAAYRTVPQQLTWHVVPELVVEIRRSPAQKADDRSRLEDFFRAGVKRVWLIDPARLKIHDHDSPSSSRTIDRRHSIEGGAILPGFTYRVAALADKEDKS
jgi:Uma2 family endonuclease